MCLYLTSQYTKGGRGIGTLRTLETGRTMEVEDRKDQPQEGTKRCNVLGSNVLRYIDLYIYVLHPNWGGLVNEERGGVGDTNVRVIKLGFGLRL